MWLFGGIGLFVESMLVCVVMVFDGWIMLREIVCSVLFFMSVVMCCFKFVLVRDVVKVSVVVRKFVNSVKCLGRVIIKS